MEGAIVPSILDVTNMNHAEEKYGNFVDIKNPVLSLSQFQNKQQLPLNEKCTAVFIQRWHV